jgi:hypothetical protein
MFNSGIGHTEFCPIGPELLAKNSIKLTYLRFFWICTGRRASKMDLDLIIVTFTDFSEKRRDQWCLNFSRVLNPVEKTRSYDKQPYLFLGKALENGIWLISIESDIHQETSVSDLCTWMKHCSKRLHQYPVKI